jgi:hypothetical protein
MLNNVDKPNDLQIYINLNIYYFSNKNTTNMNNEEKDEYEEIEYFTLVEKKANSDEEEMDLHYEMLSYQMAIAHIPESYKYKMIKDN